MPTLWKIANNGPQVRRWFVYRNLPAGTMEVAETTDGKYRRFATSKAAQRAADNLNGVR